MLSLKLGEMGGSDETRDCQVGICLGRGASEFVCDGCNICHALPANVVGPPPGPQVCVLDSIGLFLVGAAHFKFKSKD
jgi:hypothetical protein